MKKTLSISALSSLSLAVGLGATSSAFAGEFSYNGDTGPAYWHELETEEWGACEGGGGKQSPINITKKAKVDPGLELFLDIGSTAINDAYPLHNGGHNIQLDYVPGSTATFNGVTYNLIQFHFHTYSEHQVDGSHAQLEMHAVMDGGEGHLVVSQLFEVGKHDNPFLQQLIEVPLPTTTVDSPKSDDSVINLTDGLVNPASFYTYQGSLTTPPCSENVTWVVLKNPASMSEEQYQAFRTIMGNNFRPAQGLGARAVSQTPGRGRGH